MFKLPNLTTRDFKCIRGRGRCILHSKSISSYICHNVMKSLDKIKYWVFQGNNLFKANFFYYRDYSRLAELIYPEKLKSMALCGQKTGYTIGYTIGVPHVTGTTLQQPLFRYWLFVALLLSWFCTYLINTIQVLRFK